VTTFDPRLRLTTDHLLLRPFDPGDADDLLAAVAEDREMLRWMPWAPGYDRETAAHWCERVAHHDPGNALNLAIVPRAGGPARKALCGAIGLTRLSRDESTAEIGYWVAAPARGKGYATEATRAMAAYAFRLGLLRVELLAATGNLPSQRVAVNAGFTREGVLRRARPIPGGRADMVIFGLLPGELTVGGVPKKSGDESRRA
jgi:RimJ/RimL family protein N-acetyltransferase